MEATKKKWPWFVLLGGGVIVSLVGSWAFAQSTMNAPAKTAASPSGPPVQMPAATCGDLPDYGKLRTALVDVVKEGKDANTGMGNHEWAAVVNRDGVVCAVVFSGPNRGAQWPGSRAIAAEKANTANALSTPDFALSTANLYFASTPGQSLFGLTETAPPNPQAAYIGDVSAFGTATDPMVGKPIGGVVVFGGGLALYDRTGKLLGGLGVSGDTSCADHVVAWKLRHALALDAVPGGIGKNSSDNMILDVQGNTSPSGFGHPSCKGGKPSDDVIHGLTDRFPLGKKG
jgi:uncharacterized protein GlcG (DUF336 family)